MLLELGPNVFGGIQTSNRVRYTLVSINEPLPDSLFRYTPPENYRELDILESWMGRPPLALLGTQAPDFAMTTLEGRR